MRFWAVHPEYLDDKTLKQTWKGGLVILSYVDTLGIHRRSKSLSYFINTKDPAGAIAQYLSYIAEEANKRGLDGFDVSILLDKIGRIGINHIITLPYGQLCFDYTILMETLEKIDSHKKLFVEAALGLYIRGSKSVNLRLLKPHPMFRIVTGPSPEYINNLISV
jgi:hypothetical protein